MWEPRSESFSVSWTKGMTLDVLPSDSPPQQGRTRVKICGITSREDALLAAELGAHAIGIIFVPNTSRYMGERLDRVEEIGQAVRPFLTLVAVVRQLGDVTQLPQDLFHAVQYYENSGESHVARHLRRLRVVRTREQLPTADEHHKLSGLVCDAYDAHRLGGTGNMGDWDLARALRQSVKLPVILAGGLTPENVGEAVRVVQPYAVDVSSGVEHAPGKKDPEKLRKFFRAVQEANDERLSHAEAL